MTDQSIHPYLEDFEKDSTIAYREKRDKENAYNRNYMKTYYTKEDGEQKRIRRRMQNKEWYKKHRKENPVFCTPCNKNIANLLDHLKYGAHHKNQIVYDAKLAEEAIKKEREELANKMDETIQQLEKVVIEKKKLELKIDTMTIKPLEIIYEKKSRYSPRVSPRVLYG